MAITLTGIVGNLTHDPELRFTPKGDPVASFSLAINERIKQGLPSETGLVRAYIAARGRQDRTRRRAEAA